MPTLWSIESAAVSSPEGSSVSIQFRVSGLEFAPVLRLSKVVETIKDDEDNSIPTIGPIVGWRWSRPAGQLFLRKPTDEERPFAAVAISSLEADGLDWLVTVSMRLGDANQIALNNDQSTGFPSGERLFIKALLAGAVVLVGTGGVSDASTAFDYLMPVGVGVGNLDLGPSSEVIGKLPGYQDGTPALRVHCDAQAERVRRTNNDTTPVTLALTELQNLRDGGPVFTEGTPAQQPRLRVRTVKTNPYTRFLGATATFGQSESRLTLDAAAAGLNVGSGNVTFGVVAWSSQTTLAHLIGRWSGLSTQNSTKQWRMVYDPTTSPKIVRIDFARNNAVTSISTPLPGDLSERTLIMYRASTGIDAAWEVWINGELANSGSPLPLSGNTGANKRLTIGARATDNNDPPTGWGDFLNTEVASPPDALTESPGSVDQAVIYTQHLTDGELNLVFHEMSRRAGIDFGTPINVPDPATQAYGPSNPVAERRLDRRPIAMINLYGGGNYANDPLGRRKEWDEANTEWLREQVLRCLNGCDDYEILFNRPAGTYADDIIASGIFGDLRDDPGTPCISAAQWTALIDTWDEFGLSDHNVRGLGVAPADERRRAWFYTGGGISLDDDGDVTQNAGMRARIIAPLTAGFYRSEILDKWTDQDTRFRCLILDSAERFTGRFVQLVHSSDIGEHFTLVGESIAIDEAARTRAPWFGMSGLGEAPWWNSDSRNNGYNPAWTSDWTTKPIYVGIQMNEELDLTNTAGGTGNAVRGGDNLRFGDIYTFVRRGATPIAWGGQYAKIGAAWNYGTNRIPVGRFTMLSPRIARVWR